MQGTDTGTGCNLLIYLLVQEDVPTVTTSAAPPMLYDYRGFPKEVSYYSSVAFPLMLIAVLFGSNSKPNVTMDTPHNMQYHIAVLHPCNLHMKTCTKQVR